MVIFQFHSVGRIPGCFSNLLQKNKSRVKEIMSLIE